MALGAALVAATILNAAGRFADPDLWWHLKVGEVIWRNRAIPSSDLFSFTAYGHPWTAHEWLSELTMYGAYSLGGYTGLMIWVSVLASIIFLLVYLTCWLHTDNALVAFRSGMVAWCFASVGLAVRPLILGHLFLAAEILILELARTRRRAWVWLLPPIFAVWVNCHGTYMFGLAVLVSLLRLLAFTRSYGLIISEPWDDGSRRALGWAMALSAVALCANPIGVRLWLYPFDTLVSSEHRNEHRPGMAPAEPAGGANAGDDRRRRRRIPPEHAPKIRPCPCGNCCFCRLPPGWPCGMDG